MQTHLTNPCWHPEPDAGDLGMLRAWSPYLVAAALLVLTRLTALPLRAALESVTVSWDNILGI